MLPYLKDKSRIFIMRFKKYHRGDTVTFAINDIYMTKRVVACCGDHVSINSSVLCVNSDVYSLDHYEFREHIDEVSFDLKEDEYFVLGDNLDHSVDSRIFGIVRGSSIKGKTLFRLF